MEVVISSKKFHNQEYKTSLPQEVSKKLDAFFRSICDEEKFSEYHVHKRCRTGDDNFLSLIYEVDVKGRTEEAEKELHLFIKVILNLEIYAVSTMFETELFAYTDILEKFISLQEQANVDIGERYKTVKFYKESNGDILILENLAKKGFITNPRAEVQSLNFFQLAVKELAKFHALSFVIKETKPKYFHEKIKPLKYAFICKEGWKYAAASGRKASVNAVDEIFKDKVEKAFDILIDKYYEYYDDESLKTCLCYGDYRPCNILMKSNKNGIEEIMPIDYQMIHYGNPVIDLLYLIYSSTDRKFRKAHLLNLKKLYYETLGTFLQYFQLDVNLVYPRDNFERVFEEKLDFGLIISMMILPFILSSGKQLPDAEHEEVRFNFHDTFKNRLQEVIEEYMEYGVI